MVLVVTILTIAILIFIHELGHFLMARAFGMRVVKFSIGFLHPIFKWRSKKSGIQYQIGWLPLGGFVQIAGMNPFEDYDKDDPTLYPNKPTWQRFLVVFSGPFSNFLFGALLLAFIYMSGVPVLKPIIGEIVKGGRAFQLGLMPNDEIIKINNKEIKSWNELLYLLKNHPGNKIELYVKRSSSIKKIVVSPHPHPTYGYMLGIKPRGDFFYEKSIPPHKAIPLGLIKATEITGEMLVGLINLIRGKGEGRLTGPIGIVKQGTKQLKSGWKLFFSFIATLNIALFLLNMLPLPALDGSHIGFLLIGALLRKPINKKIEAILHTIGFVFLLLLLILVTIRDILT